LERGKPVAEAPVQENSEQTKPAGPELTPEICINNASIYSRLRAAGRQARVADTTLRTVSRLFFGPFSP
jgi:hypothetical protein